MYTIFYRNKNGVPVISFFTLWYQVGKKIAHFANCPGLKIYSYPSSPVTDANINFPNLNSKVHDQIRGWSVLFFMGGRNNI